MVGNELVGELAECLEETLRLQSRVTEATERAYRAAGMSVADRALRGKMTGLGRHLELNRAVLASSTELRETSSSSRKSAQPLTFSFAVSSL
jgi:hypothetical protein